MKAKKWCILFVIIYSCVLFIIGVSVVIIDPYFHYHKPLSGIYYAFDKDEYINDGITKNFSYEGIITGSSTTLGFKTEEAGELFSQQFIRVSYPGEGFRKMKENLESAFSHNSELHTVIWGVDPMWFILDKDYLNYDEYPDYLYDDNILNDTNYIFNKEILMDDFIPAIVKTVNKVPTDTFDSVAGYASGSKDKVLSAYKRPEKENQMADPMETDEYFSMLEENLQENIISIVNAHPEVTFYIFFPPYNICWWDSFNQVGKEILLRRIDMEQYAIEKFLECDNIQLFSFNDDYDLICDLDNYTDNVHYSQSVSSYILTSMKEDKHRLTKDNYEEYLRNIREFYTNYDYDLIFEGEM